MTYPKGYHILEASKTETNIFFIKKGIVRAYIPVDGKKLHSGSGRGFCHCLAESYVDNQQGYESMELMESRAVYLLKRKDLQELFKEDIHIANWGRKVCRIEFMQKNGRKAYFLLFTNASERYMN